MDQNNTTKSYIHHTTSDRSIANIWDDKPLITGLFEAVANREGVHVSRILISKSSIRESVTGVLCTNGDIFDISITVKYKVLPGTIVTTKQQ